MFVGFFFYIMRFYCAGEEVQLENKKRAKKLEKKKDQKQLYYMDTI